VFPKEESVMKGRLHLACLAVCAAALLIISSPASGDSCATFSNLEHCPLGDASLAVSGEALEVSGVGTEGEDGVAITLPDSVAWHAGLRFADGNSSPRVTLGAEAGGDEISTAEIVAADGGLQLSATFTGADGPGTYSILIYRDGTLVGSEGGISIGHARLVKSTGGLVIVDICDFLRLASGACVWEMGFGQPVRLSLSDGTEVEGDEVHLVEEVDGAGHYPYVTFDGITLRSSRDVEILSEVTH
jgi:hypothetical protein